jgi:molecular chaperone DnaK (HSP70)
VKLFLDPRQELPAFVSKSEMKQLLAKSGKDAVSVVADYLCKVYQHTKDELVKRYGDLFVQTTDTQWVLTVPAIWSDAAKNATLTAARRAGMGPQLTLISEPEAAAVYTLQAIQPNHLKVGDNIVVCDAGGGTVDLIAYEIKQARPLRIEESAEGSGACCGAAMLNTKFEDLIRQKMGSGPFSKLYHDKSRTWLTAQKYFEDHVKRNFDPTDPTDFNIPFPGVTDDHKAGIEQGFLTLSFMEVADMFRPIITDIMDLVEDQISKVRSKGKIVTGVVLVGGFGQSGCLYKALKLRYTGQSEGRRPGTQFDVLQPANAWTAVVRGAVLRGMEGVEMVRIHSYHDLAVISSGMAYL